MDHQALIERVDDNIVNRPKTVILVFLVVTGVFAVGLGAIQIEAGTEQFAEDVPENEALEQVNDEFSPRFEPDTGDTTLIQRGGNVLSRDAMLRMIQTQQRLDERTDLRVTGTSSAASVIARSIDPEAESLEDQERALRRATDGEVRSAVRENADNPAFTGSVSDDFNAEAASASATIGSVEHEMPGAGDQAAGQGGESPLTDIQQRSQRIADTAGVGDITVFGSGIIADEFDRVISDSLIVVTPISFLLIVLFLVFAYRDPVDLLLGIVALVMTLVWTFGFLGLVGIPFNQLMIAIPPLLLAIGIDFGIHAINRYREELEEGFGKNLAMRRATDQLIVAFFIVTVTTAIGFLSNLVSKLIPIREFGIVAAVGIVFTFLIFGVFLPAAKVWTDDVREEYDIPVLSNRPLGSEGSPLGSILRVGTILADRVPVVVLVVALLLTGGAAGYATGVDTTFDQRDFLPPEEPPEYYDHLPAQLQPGEYVVTAQLNFLEDNFEASQQDSATVYLETRMHDPSVLQSIDRAGDDPPPSYVSEQRRADQQSIVTVIQDQAERDPEFRELVQRHDRTGDGIPDKNVGEVYDYLLDSPAEAQTRRYLADDRRSTRVVYTVEADATDQEITDDTWDVADRMRGEATATGQTVVFRAVSDVILESAIRSMLVAFTLTVLFLVGVYGYLERRPSLGIANSVPIAIAVAGVAGSMRLLDVPFNAVTATILALTIGLGVDYSVHITHRFVDERRRRPLMPALDRTVRGTGGALAGTMLTTISGIGVLTLAILEVIGQFGILTGLSILYAFFASIVVLPSVLVVWDWLVVDNSDEPLPSEGDRPR